MSAGLHLDYNHNVITYTVFLYFLATLETSMHCVKSVCKLNIIYDYVCLKGHFAMFMCID